MTEEFKAYILALGKYCRDETYHGEYELSYHWEPEACGDDTDDSCVRAAINVESVYLYAAIKIYPSLFELYVGGDFKCIARNILHEICHIFTDPLRRLAMSYAAPRRQGQLMETVERQTQRIANTVFDLLPKDWYLPENLLKSEPKSKPEGGPRNKKKTNRTLRRSRG